eukprot:TRINITY_DN14725_c0_g1_i1.p1 TRINITY_DN14725_c0_g1~~TRINITY_DN14725_c0_g1_i1.p1  ORF type:complete len:218 (+),score=48.82 TRINITY_DN14725_c0_g1_i1:34-654(+)
MMMMKSTMLLSAVGLCLVSLLVATSFSNASPPRGVVVPWSYPSYRQCDPEWSNTLMGGGATICQEGCAMSCVSMGLAGKNFFFNQTVMVTPATLNDWLIHNNGYTCIAGDCNNLVIDSPQNIIPGAVKSLGEFEKPSAESLQEFLMNTTTVIGHVRNNTHFVLLTGFIPGNFSTFWVNDPFYNSTTYEYDEITDVIVYEMTFQNDE